MKTDRINQVISQIQFLIIWPVIAVVLVLFLKFYYLPFSGGDIGFGLVGINLLDYLLLAPLPGYFLITIVYLLFGYFRHKYFPKYFTVVLVIISFLIFLISFKQFSWVFGDKWVNWFLNIIYG
jgi:hypothetical protein